MLVQLPQSFPAEDAQPEPEAYRPPPRQRGCEGYEALSGVEKIEVCVLMPFKNTMMHALPLFSTAPTFYYPKLSCRYCCGDRGSVIPLNCSM
jgi:hypothetical protein